MAIILYILSVNLDAIGVGISYGVRKIHIPLVSGAIIALFSVVYSALALALGGALVSVMPQWVSQMLGSGILLILGVCIIMQALLPHTPPREESKSHSFRIRALGLTISLVLDPVACDFDNSSKIDAREALYLGLALSLDAIGVGIGAGLSGYAVWYLPLAIGLAQLAFLSVGSFLGNALVRLKRIDRRVWQIVAGVLLVALAAFKSLP